MNISLTRLARFLAVYRNNVVVSLVDALAQTFPVTHQLVGEAFFRALAQVFVRAHPPRTRVLSHYGDGLPGFVARFPPAAGLPYLADVARVEWALHCAATWPDATIDTASFARLSTEDPAGLSLALAPRTTLIESDFPVVALITG